MKYISSFIVRIQFIFTRSINATVSTCIKTTLVIALHQKLGLNTRCSIEAGKRSDVGECMSTSSYYRQLCFFSSSAIKNVSGTDLLLSKSRISSKSKIRDPMQPPDDTF